MIRHTKEVKSIEDANYVFIIDDHRGIGFTNGRYYKLYDYHGEKYAIDNSGRQNYGISNLVKIKMINVEDTKYINHLIEKVKKCKVENSMTDFCYNNLLESIFELYEDLNQKNEVQLSDKEYHFKNAVCNYIQSLELNK
ncbi:hypothetical protein P4H70_12165 [Paenibacillus ehimensis]|uniref:hypothetical protein n=1 Tax=Paenibacillus ehimensis TaxID=79264 RepID=UPI002DBFB883|nr:hypothetical protein [Paenibacillus ehimensis]MEC0209686.1 hypothetical protein [Paenibacillus ehimensis]